MPCLQVLTDLRERFCARGTVTLQKAFHKFDIDKSGFLSVEEFHVGAAQYVWCMLLLSTIHAAAQFNIYLKMK